MINLGATSDGQGRVYIATSGEGCRLFALDSETGETVWCSGIPNERVVSSAPLIDKDGFLYIADDEFMRSFDREGRVRWSFPIKGLTLSAQFMADDDIIFITHIGVVYKLNRTTGQPSFPPETLVPNVRYNPGDGALACMRGLRECPVANTPAVDLKRSWVFSTFWHPDKPNAGLISLQLNGPIRERWYNLGFAGGTASSPTLSADGGRVYVTDNGGNLHAISAETGKTIWTLNIGYEAGGSVSISPEGLIMPAGGTGAPLLAVRDEGRTGSIVWRQDSLTNFGISTQAMGFKAYPTVKTGPGSLDVLVVDTKTGAILDRDKLPGQNLFSVGTTIDRQATVYVATINGGLHAFASELEASSAPDRSLSSD